MRIVRFPSRAPLFTKVFCDAFQERFGSKYVYCGGKDGAAMKRFLAAAPDITVEEWERVLKSMWNGKDEFMRTRIVTIAAFISMWNRAVAQSPKPKQKVGESW
jgi:hypothetical protein